MKKRKIQKIRNILLCVVLFFLLLDYVPVKFAYKASADEEVFIHSHKIIAHTQWVMDSYGNDRISLCEGCIVTGNTPDLWLAERDFDCRILFNMDGDQNNRFILHYDEKMKIAEAESWEVQYRIEAKNWDIVYPISRISFRRYTAPKGYLTVYDYDWIAVIRRWMKQ